MPDMGKSEAAAPAPAPAPAPHEGSKDKVGDILRKERLTRRITIETIAKDLKLNVGYIKALEASDYESLPADPYVRVYIKSLTKYLSLNSDSIMKEFYQERGMIAAEESDTSNKIDISVQRQERNPTAVVVIALIVALAIFAFIANQKGWLQPSGTYIETVDKDSTATVYDAVAQEPEDTTISHLDPSLYKDTAAAEPLKTKSTPRR